MANANINLNAVDNTRAAFLSVQNSLQRLGQETQKVGQSMLRGFSGRTLATALGLNIQNISQQLARIVTGMSKEMEAAYKALEASSDKLARASIANMRDQASEETKLKLLLLERQRLNDKLAQGKQSAGFTFGTSAQAETFAFFGATGQRNREISAQAQADTNEMIARVNELDMKIRALGRTHLKVFEGTIKDQKSLEDSALKLTNQLHQVGISTEFAFVTSAKKASMKEMKAALSDISNEYKVINDRLRDAMEGFDVNATDQEKHIADIKTINELLAQRNHILEKYNSTAINAIGTQKEHNKLAEEAGKILANGFEDAIFAGEKLSGVIKQLGQDIMRLIFRRMVTAPLADFFSGGISKILGFADGGRPPVGKPSIVGERGPELFVPSSAGTIIPNHKLGGVGGGGSTYYIDARGADQTGLARLEGMIRQTQASIVPMALGAVMNAKARGSAFYA
jgi:hypothetical protein